MKKLHYEIMSTNNEGLISLYEEIMAVAMDQIEKLVCRYRYILPRGWRSIIKIEDPKQAKVHLDLQSNQSGGSFAEVKMKTLERFNKAATGTDDIKFIHDLIPEYLHHLAHGLTTPETVKQSNKAYDFLKMISTEITSATELRRSHHEWLREELGYTNYYGAFCVPFDVLSAKVGSSNDCQRGLIKVAFSGASEEQDVMFAMWIFQRIQEAMVETFKKDQFWFNLRDLEEIPKIRFWIDNLRVRETA